MSKSESTLMVYFYSEAEDVSLGFGISFDPETDSIESLGTDWILEGMTDSFWENYEEFEPGINKAKILEKQNSGMTHRQALMKVFGDFIASCEMDGEETENNINIDANEAMYNLLES